MPNISTMYSDNYPHNQNPYLYETQLQHRLQPKLVEQRTFSRLEILRHNASVGWQQWLTLKGMVYDASGFRDHFLLYLHKKREAREKKAFSEQVSAQHEDTVSGTEERFKQNSTADERTETWNTENKSRTSVDEQNLANQERTLKGESQGRNEVSSEELSDEDESTTSSHSSSVSDSDDELSDDEDSFIDSRKPGGREQIKQHQRKFSSPRYGEQTSHSNSGGEEDDVYRLDVQRYRLSANGTKSGRKTNGLSAVCYQTLDSPEAEELWQHDVIHVLRQSGLSLAEIEAEIGPFAIGTLERVPQWRVWESVRADVIMLHDDLVQSEGEDELSQNQRDYLTLLRRWLRKYRDIDPLQRPMGGDLNDHVFFLPQDPGTLREWAQDLEPMDTQLPENGAWTLKEFLLPPLGDTHQVFASLLRSHFSSDDVSFHFDITGEAAWRVLPQNVIEGEMMTSQQKRVQQSRDQLGDRLWDPVRMRRKRQKLGKYFMDKYHIPAERMTGYLQWGDVMEHNQRELEVLCQE